MSNCNEALLRAWLKMSTSVVNNRLVTELSFNEALICNILFREQLLNGEKKITATDLCNRTKMLKSQMNRTLGKLEARGIIRRERSNDDRRQVFVLPNPDRAGLYHHQHQQVLSFVDAIIDEIGEEKAMQTMALLEEISAVADKILQNQKFFEEE